jgi:ADP-ribose pyrophosphatase
MMTDENRTWKVLQSEYLFREPWFTVRRERVELPTGKQVPAFYVLDYPDWVNTIALTRDGQFVMIRQYRHGIRRVCTELSAGVCETSDTSPLESAQRELLEETGFGGGDWMLWMTLSPNPSANSNLTHCFLAHDVEKISEQHLDDGEDITVHLMSAAEVKQLLDRGEILQSLMAAPLWRYFAENPLTK